MVTFILKSAIVLGCSYGFYYLLFRRSLSFSFIRFFLLFSMILAVIIPFIEIRMGTGSPLNQGIYSDDFAIGMLEQGEAGIAGSGRVWTLGQVMLIFYFLGSITLFIRFSKNLVKLIGKSFSSESIRYEGYRILLLEEATLPYSFFNAIFVNRSAFEGGEITRELLMHEKAHCVQKHSLDILAVEIFKIVLWFNPFVWLFQKAIRETHEYIADDRVLHERNREEYQLQLLNLVLRNQSIYLASDFDFSLTKKRLMMMNLKHSRNRDILKRVAAIPLFLILLGTLTFCENDKTDIMDSGEIIEHYANDWWKPILEKHNITPSAYNNFEYVFEMGSTNSISNGVVTLDDALFLIRQEGNLYSILRSPHAIHNLETNVIQGAKGILTIYDPDKNKIESIETMEFYDFKYRITRGSNTWEAKDSVVFRIQQ